MRARYVAAGLALVVAGAGRAQAEPATCPSHAAVERALGELEAKDPGRFPKEEALGSLELSDGGARFAVTVAGRTREYADPGRDCERRARLAAVFVALVLTERRDNEEARAKADEVPPVPVAPSARPQPPPPPPAPKPRAERRALSLDAGGRLAFAPVSPAMVVVPAVEVGAAYQPGMLGVRLAVGVPVASGTLAVGRATARLARYPLYLALRLPWALDPFALALDAGPEVALLRVRREGDAAGTNRVDVGARVSVTLALRSARLSPYLSILSEWVPERFGLALQPDGVLRETPAFWLGAAAGAVLAL